jgi:DNA phosphorothioation-dependent restriction protein DptG
MNLLERVIGLSGRQVESKNKSLKSFFPLRKGGKEFEYGAVAGSVLCSIVGKCPRKGFTLDVFKATCIDRLKHRLSESDVIDHLARMYFDGDALLNRAPRFLLLKGGTGENASTRHLAEIFSAIVSVQSIANFEGSTTFIESIFIEVLNENLTERPFKRKEHPYLPFVADCFQKDLLFLDSNSDYLMANIEAFFELYNLIYCTQLALNLTQWKTGDPPIARPLYFILDNERFSSERTQLKSCGFKPLASAVSRVFPRLSVLEYLNDGSADPAEPLWAFAAAILRAPKDSQEAAAVAIREFSLRFQQDRKLIEKSPDEDSAIEALDLLLQYSEQQFAEGTTKHRVQSQYVELFEKTVAQNFIQSRGRAGKVLVINQDFVLLLTNLAIGHRTKMRFQEVIKEFQMRGFYFDKQSEQALISFYERVGNVERLSDSGDAVYVRSTI